MCVQVSQSCSTHCDPSPPTPAPLTVAHQAPLSMGFSRQENWSGRLYPPPGDLPNPGIERVSLVSPTLQADSLLLEPLRKPSASHQMSQIHVCSGPYLQCSESTFASSEYNYVLMPASVGDMGLTPGSGRPPGEENGNPLQYSFLEDSMNKGAWQAAVDGVAKSWT